MNIVLITFYYSPDLSAGSFRATALVQALKKKMNTNDNLHIITTHPNRYANYRKDVKNIEIDGNVSIHRIAVPSHKSGMISQMHTFTIFAFYAYSLCRKLKPDFLIGTTSRLMTGLLTWFSSRMLHKKFFIDLRDIFSETISDLLMQKSYLLGRLSKFFFIFLEKRVLKNASGVNIVSEGFVEYFETKGVDTSNWSFYPNGVDQEFLNLPFFTKSLNSRKAKKILYAGNIGSGQGLEKIIPFVAKRLGSGYRFIVIGDGSTISLLRDAIKKEKLKNIDLLAPMERSKLIKHYQNADILFLHLNNFLAFHRVLPSKIFEYVAIGKPIVAGLNGYSEKFLKNHVPYAYVFNPGDIVTAASCIERAASSEVPVAIYNSFVKTYSRVSIMDRMASHLFDIIEKKNE